MRLARNLAGNGALRNAGDLVEVEALQSGAVAGWAYVSAIAARYSPSVGIGMQQLGQEIASLLELFCFSRFAGCLVVELGA